jgi:hypothetical protein
MKQIRHFFAWIGILIWLFPLAGCKRNAPPADPSLPEALQVSSESNYSHKYRFQDLLSKMFDEILDKRPEVKAVVDSQTVLLSSIGDELTNIHASDGKTQEYYAAARHHIQEINDSTLRFGYFAKIEASEKRWKNQMAKRDFLDHQLRSALDELNDELQAFMVRLTLPQIEDYQAKSMPNLDSGNALLKKKAKLVEQMHQF